MSIILAVIGIIICVIIIFFNIPYSKTKTEFNKIISEVISKTSLSNEVILEEDIKDLPPSLQNYFSYAGFLGKQKPAYMSIIFEDADFIMTDRHLRIDYTQYDFVDKPLRYALIESSIYGVPFQGMDYLSLENGGMKGVIAKTFQIFNVKDEFMYKSGLVTWLAECVFCPTSILQDFIKWEQIDETHVKGTIDYNGVSASGVLTFNDNGAMILFESYDRGEAQTDGTIRPVKWSTVCDDYKENNGFMQPTVLKTINTSPDKEVVYFDSNNFEIKYNYQK
ncbi:DUF6544 family protein [Clostridium vincentii]|uniref:Uncharacterized protein n=1 Tax=Clostridium vincentii TaxID=52704 RepID=A0A2T0BKC0_9CLOT|nr:DUF6544 family protein [Clostridium vincentii]PRR84335.1 hypothetical protein CLVI_02610 [Clostridium vincentii]